MFEEIRILLKETIGKLSQFRRHPDWQAAFNHVVDKSQHLMVEIDGQRGFSFDTMKKLFDLADEEFIERIIAHDRVSDPTASIHGLSPNNSHHNLTPPQ